MCTTSTNSVKSLSNPELLRELRSLVARDRATTAVLLAHLAEVDARRLYVPAGYPSMHAYCVGELKFSEDEAYARIRVARAGRAIPALLAALAAGRIHMTGARLLAPHLTNENVEGVVSAATHRNKFEIERLIERRFGALPMSTLASTEPAESGELVPERVEFARELAQSDARDALDTVELSTMTADDAATRPPIEAAVEFVVAPSSAPMADPAACFGPVDDRIVLKVALDRATHEKLVYARQLLGHAVPSGDVGRVLDRALDVLIARLEKQKFAAAKRPRVPKAAPASAKRTDVRKRYASSHVKRVVWKRDGGRCTFVAPSGHRCEARHRLEYDHVDPFAMGGEATIDGLRLRCRAHNQYAAEQAFGVEFMNAKREAARRAIDSRRAASPRRQHMTSAGGLPAPS